MPITVTCPNPSCGQVCAVQDQYAGMQVSCPKCQTVFGVPAAVSATPMMATPTAAPAGGAAPIGPGIAGIMNNVGGLAGDPTSKMLILAGLGCLLGCLLFLFLPWFSVSSGPIGGSVSGFNAGNGAFILLLAIGAAAFVIVAVAMNRADLFNYSIYAGAGIGALIALLCVIDLSRMGSVSAPGMRAGAGIGVYLTLLAGIGAAGTFGFLAFQRLPKNPSAPPPPPSV